MKKFRKIIAAATAVILCLGAAGCQKSTELPDYYNPSEVVETNEKYVVNVQSAGGLKLDGVVVDLVRDGGVVKRGISINGKIEFGVQLDAYELRIDQTSLPAGYYVEDGVKYTTNPERRDEITIKIPSKVTAQPAKSYTVGNIMNDFVFTDCVGIQRKLSTTLESKKAVVINFFYTGCQPCRSEFPAIQRAYTSFSDKLEIFAICSTHMSDTNSTVSSFKGEYGLTFPMGIDDTGIISDFNVTAFPTTVIIDRYGMIAYKSTGTETDSNVWAKHFADFTSDNYVQNVTVSGGSTQPGTPTEPERVLPNVNMPDSSVMSKAASGEGMNVSYRADEDVYSWPWLATSGDNDGYIYTSNKGVHSSYSIVYCDVQMEAGDVLSFDYNVSSEKDCDKLYALIDGQIMNADGWSATDGKGENKDGWLTCDIFVADRKCTVELAFAYQKDKADLSEEAAGEDTAKIRNIHAVKTSDLKTPMDVIRPAAIKKTDSKDEYDYVTCEPDEKGMYHVVYNDGGQKTVGSILYVTIVQPTAWCDIHMNGETTSVSDEGDTYYNSLYYMTFYNYRQGSENNIKFVLNGSDEVTSTILEAANINMFMEEPYYLIPVTEDIYKWINEFAKQWHRDNGGSWYENEWLEFCYYYDHYGPEHAEGDECDKVADPTRGLTMRNCYYAYEEHDPELATSETKGTLDGANKAVIRYPIQTYRGTYYKFVAPTTGVYQIRSYTTGCSYSEIGEIYPTLFMVDEQGNYINKYGTNGYATMEVTGALDFDQYTTERYEGFNTYLTMQEGEVIYLKTCLDLGDTGYYDFKITYLGESYTKMLIGSTNYGLWESNERYSGIGFKYNAEDDTYYALTEGGEQGNEIYIDLLYENFYIYGKQGSNLPTKPLKDYIDQEVFTSYNTLLGPAQDVMLGYLAEATSLDPSDPHYGMVKADKMIVGILQQLVDDISQGGGEGNGWLAFACFEHTYGDLSK